MRFTEEQVVAGNQESIPDGDIGRIVASQVLAGPAALFVGSGCAALIYEVVWLQMLQLVIGSSGVSLGPAWDLHGRDVPGKPSSASAGLAQRHPLRVYALLELGIAAYAVGLLYGLPYIDQIYITHVGHGLAFRGLMCAACLLLPTLLMGAALPAIARWVEATPRRRLLAGLLLWRRHHRPYSAACSRASIAESSRHGYRHVCRRGH